MISKLRSFLRSVVPQPLRQNWAQLKRSTRDARARVPFAVRPNSPTIAPGYEPFVAIAQPIRRTAHFEGKLHNLTSAAERLNGLLVAPGEVASFWHLVGEPVTKNGFQMGRTIINDRLSTDIGGGLCQMGSMLYEIGLRTGMTIVERFPHTRDLYTEDNRFTPLGLDAAVVWGFKDVRIRNQTANPLFLAFRVDGETLHGEAFSPVPIQPFTLRIDRADSGATRSVTVMRERAGAMEAVSRNDYVIDPT